MLGERQQWVPYPSLNTAICLSHLWTWDVGIDGDPCARDDGNETTPHNIPDRPAVCEVTAMIRVQ